MVRMQELVTLGPLAEGRADPVRHTAIHLSPQEFHDRLLEAQQQHQHQRQAQQQEGCGARGADGGSGSNSSGSGQGGAGVVLLDARNIYETRIGHFEAVGGSMLHAAR